MPGGAFDDDFESELLVRPFVVTRGRAATSPGLRVDSTVLATGRVLPSDIQADHARALELCQRPRSVAEVAAHMRLPVQIVKVLVSDLLTHAALTVRAAGPVDRAEAPDREFLEVVLHGLRAL
ncbi:DUF742 domain-containing protein [Saccharopolyspora pogona]|uniref:DUF742 domain-containing protein n=1 Tax=Saccharopolyspora pogona TaxID=333966 RepID=UPI0016887326|nr:DUF742 domain-containing protein [Saccharopolyspora pogona]